MAKNTRKLIAAMAAFAASPQGRKFLQEAKAYAARPETKQRAQQLIAQARSRRKGASDPGAPEYGTPPAR